MKRIYTTANGKKINIDAIISQNENTIAVGNMKVNARGDQLGPGGVVEVPKNKVMSDYYKLNTPVATDEVPQSHRREVKKDLTDDWVEPVVSIEDTAAEEERPMLRGSLADSVAKSQPQPKEQPKKTGPSRI